MIHPPKRKKLKPNFAEVVSRAKKSDEFVATLNDKAVSLARCVEGSWRADVDMNRVLSKCEEETAELMVVSKLGLVGVDILRSAMKLVPESFSCGLRAEIVTEIVNTVAKKELSVCDCETLMSFYEHNLAHYYSREPSTSAYEDALLQLTHKNGKGFCAFLGPPVTQCMHCPGKKLTQVHEMTKITVCDLSGPRPGSKLNLTCSTCGTNYHYSKYGKRNTNGEKFYDQERPYIEASEVMFVHRDVHNLFTSLSLHCWVSFAGFAEVLFEVWKPRETSLRLMKDHGYCTELSRKHISDAFFNAELESEFHGTEQKDVFTFTKDCTREGLMQKVLRNRLDMCYVHSPSVHCKEKGCGSCWTFDGNWKLGFPHCMFPVRTVVDGFPNLNFPNICVEEPQPGKAFCSRHCLIAEQHDIPTELKEYNQFKAIKGEIQVECSAAPSHPVARDQGTDEFLKTNPTLTALCEMAPNKIVLCNKDTGDGSKLQKWSRGHLFIVRPCGHIDDWHPLYHSESPSQVFIITIKWLYEVLRNRSEDTWKDVILCYDNMCHLDGLKVAQQDLPFASPYNKMWKAVTKIIDSLHIKNHIDKKCLELYHPKQVKEEHPKFNLMCAEQTFTWLSRYKKIVCSMNKTHHCFFIHRLVLRRNRYNELCWANGRKPLLPKAKE